MFKKVLNFIKNEIQLTKEYYQNLEPPEQSPALNDDGFGDDDEIQITYQGLTFSVPKPITNEEYQYKRRAAEAWLEAHYDLNSAEGIRSIPETGDLPRPPDSDSDGFRDYTCDVDYYLRFKSAWFEDAGNIELAVLCLKKSNAIRMATKRGYKKDDYYTLVRLLARSGLVKEAQEERRKIDKFFQGYTIDNLIGTGPMLTKEERHMEDSDIEREVQRGIDKRDYKWLQENLPDICPKSYSGYKRMKNGNTKNYQKLAARAKEMGRDIS